jgi:glycosyltransferase involved in cell wall biosynthesis
MPRTLIVVPCYNEAKRLDTGRFRSFASENASVCFLFVNDGSRDGTGAVLDELAASDPERFRVCHLAENSGKAEAVRQGLLRALGGGDGSGFEYVGYWDADLATPLEAVLTFAAVLDSRPDIDLVCGARVTLLGRSVERQAVRHYLGRIFATVASMALGVGFYDTQCGAKLFRVSPELPALFEDPFATRWIFDVEILARMIAARAAVGRPGLDRAVFEYPLHEWHDVAGSKVRARDFLKAFFGLAAIRWQYGGPLALARRQRVAAGRSWSVPGAVRIPVPAPRARLRPVGSKSKPWGASPRGPRSSSTPPSA